MTLEDLPPVQTAVERRVRAVRSFLVTHFSFFQFHAAYFLLISLIGGAVMYEIERVYGVSDVRFVDALFMATSAASQTGLQSLDMGSLTTGSAVVIMVLSILGSQILMSAVPVMIRRYYFEQHASKAIADEEERRRVLEIETLEYRALSWVTTIVLCYWLALVTFSFITIGLYLQFNEAGYNQCVNAGFSPWFWSIFHTITALNNAGFGLFSDNLMSFMSHPLVLIVLSINILFGNTAYPIAFRFIVWCLHRIYGDKEPALKMLLDRPRKHFTHMFRSGPTLALLLTIIGFTVFEFVLFLIMDYNEPFMAVYPPDQRVLAGWFQAISTRTAGFNCINLAFIAPSMQVLYALMMYVAAYPQLITVRRSQEKSKHEDNAHSLHSGDTSAYPFGSSSLAGEAVDLQSFSRSAPSPAGLALTLSAPPMSARDAVASRQRRVSAMAMPSLSELEPDASPSTPVREPHPSRAQAQGQPQLLHRKSALRVQTAVGESSPPPGVPQSVTFGNDSCITPPQDRSFASDASAGHDNREDSGFTPGSEARLRRLRRSSVGGESTLELNVEALHHEGEVRPAGNLSRARDFISRDLPILFIALFLVCISEDDNIRNDGTKALNIWSILFELVSAFGTVGLTLGYPTVPYSLSGIFTDFGKVVTMFVMLAGRHRGLPQSIDEAVSLPSLLNKKAPPPDKLGPRASTFLAVTSRVLNTPSLMRGGSLVLLRSRLFDDGPAVGAGPNKPKQSVAVKRTGSLPIIPDAVRLAAIQKAAAEARGETSASALAALPSPGDSVDRGESASATATMTAAPAAPVAPGSAPHPRAIAHYHHDELVHGSLVIRADKLRQSLFTTFNRERNATMRSRAHSVEAEAVTEPVDLTSPGSGDGGSTVVLEMTTLPSSSAQAAAETAAPPAAAAAAVPPPPAQQ